MYNVNNSWAIYYPKTKKSYRKIICKVSKSFRRKEEEKQQYGQERYRDLWKKKKAKINWVQKKSLQTVEKSFMTIFNIYKLIIVLSFDIQRL